MNYALEVGDRVRLSDPDFTAEGEQVVNAEIGSLGTVRDVLGETIFGNVVLVDFDKDDLEPLPQIVQVVELERVE